MHEIIRGKTKYIVVDGQKFPYDGKIEVYVDTATGNWVVNTHYSAETVVGLLCDVVDNFLHDIHSQSGKTLEDLEADHDIDVKRDVILMPYVPGSQ